jgi:hypothetical protein
MIMERKNLFLRGADRGPSLPFEKKIPNKIASLPIYFKFARTNSLKKGGKRPASA